MPVGAKISELGGWLSPIFGICFDIVSLNDKNTSNQESEISNSNGCHGENEMDISSEVEHSGSSGEKKKRRQPGKEQTHPIYQDADWLKGSGITD